MDRVSAARAHVIEGFARLLAELRATASSPSFRVMAGRSGAISHTTLHEAVQGNRMPSWETTAEFVKACGADPHDYRARWEKAHEAVCQAPPGRGGGPRPSSAVAPGERRQGGDGRTEVSPGVGDDRTADVLPSTAPGPPQPRSASNPSSPNPGTGGSGRDHHPGATSTRRAGWRRSGWYAAGAVSVVALIVAGVVLARSGDDRDGRGPGQTAVASAADCPVRQSNPAAASPLHPGDEASFISDLTLPDCTHLLRGEAATKVWRLKNSGTVPWVGYTLQRVDMPEDTSQCETIPDVPVAPTEPGSMVDVTVEVMAPRSPAFCFVRFKMLDADGQVAFPGSRPVNFQVVVD